MPFNFSKLKFFPADVTTPDSMVFYFVPEGKADITGELTSTELIELTKLALKMQTAIQRIKLVAGQSVHVVPKSDGSISIALNAKFVDRVYYSAELHDLFSKEIKNIQQIYLSIYYQFELPTYLFFNSIKYGYELAQYFMFFSEQRYAEMLEVFKLESLPEVIQKFNAYVCQRYQYENYLTSFKRDISVNKEPIANAVKEEKETNLSSAKKIMLAVNAAKKLEDKEKAAKVPFSENLSEIRQGIPKCNALLQEIYQLEEKEILAVMPDKLTDLELSDSLNNHHKNGFTIAMMAANSGYLQVLERLQKLDSHIDFNSQNNKTGETALMLAVESGHVEVVKFLINNGARIDLVDKSGESVIARVVKQYDINHPISKTFIEVITVEPLSSDLVERYKENIRQKMDILPGYVMASIPVDLSLRERVNKSLSAFYSAIGMNNAIFAAPLLKEQHSGFDLRVKLEEFEKHIVHCRTSQPQLFIHNSEREQEMTAIDSQGNISMSTISLNLFKKSIKYVSNVAFDELNELVIRYLTEKDSLHLLADFVAFFGLQEVFWDMMHDSKNCKMDSWVIHELRDFLYVSQENHNFRLALKGFKQEYSYLFYTPDIKLPAFKMRSSKRILPKSIPVHQQDNQIKLADIKSDVSHTFPAHKSRDHEHHHHHRHHTFKKHVSYVYNDNSSNDGEGEGELIHTSSNKVVIHR